MVKVAWFFFALAVALFFYGKYNESLIDNNAALLIWMISYVASFYIWLWILVKRATNKDKRSNREERLKRIDDMYDHRHHTEMHDRFLKYKKRLDKQRLDKEKIDKKKVDRFLKHKKRLDKERLSRERQDSPDIRGSYRKTSGERWYLREDKSRRDRRFFEDIDREYKEAQKGRNYSDSDSYSSKHSTTAEQHEREKTGTDHSSNNPNVEESFDWFAWSTNSEDYEKSEDHAESESPGGNASTDDEPPSGQKPKASDQDRYYASLLGLSGKVTKLYIKKAYKQKVKEYHPDRVQTMGKDIKDVAAKRMREINEA